MGQIRAPFEPNRLLPDQQRQHLDNKNGITGDSGDLYHKLDVRVLIDLLPEMLDQRKSDNMDSLVFEGQEVETGKREAGMGTNTGKNISEMTILQYK